MMDLFAELKAVCEAQPATIASFSKAGFIHFGAFGRNIEHSARYALGRGVKPGDLVVVRSGQPDIRLQIILGLMRLGCCVGIGPALDDYKVHDLKIDWLITDDPKPPSGQRFIPIDMKWLSTGDPYRPAALPADPEFSLIFSSSGSTGRAKMMKMSKVGFLHRVEAKMADPYFGERPRYLSTAGDSTSTTLQDSLVVLLMGGTIFRPYSRQGVGILDAIQFHKPTYAVIAPATLVEMLLVIRETPASLDRIGVIRLAGSYCAPETQAEALELLADNIVTSYGATEIGRVAWGYYSDNLKTPRSVGRIKDDVDVITVDESGKPLPPGTEGELRIKVPAGVPIEYFGEPSSKTFDGDWFIPGDIGRVDENRNLIVMGRASLVINYGGTKVSPEAIEEALASYAGIKDCGAAGVDGENGFQRIAVAIVSKDQVDPTRLTQYLQKKNNRYGVHILKRVDSIPRTPTGKIDRMALKQLLQG